MRKKEIVGVYLAAGQSRRMGCNKLKLPLGTGPLGSIALRKALQSRIDHVIVAVHNEDALDWIAPDLWASPSGGLWEVLRCEESRNGMAYTLKCAVRSAERMGAEAIVVMLADQPGLSVHMLDDLIWEARRQQPGEAQPLFYAYRHEGNFSPPVLIRRAAFTRLYALEGDEGARRAIRSSAPHEAVFLASNETDRFTDIDTLQEYEAALAKWFVNPQLFD